MGILKPSNTSAELKRAREQREIDRLRNRSAREAAKAKQIEAKADARLARNERYRAVTEAREAHGGAAIVICSIEELPKSGRKTPPNKAAKKLGGSRTPAKAATSRKTAPAKPSKTKRR
ncbi:hypothetical protein TALC_00371 [Thermoplasmatales archaeon BRNA1]|nr:hypothetical protein TALC_00371 [Thermoplasmatales archaeon BRNA1]